MQVSNDKMGHLRRGWTLNAGERAYVTGQELQSSRVALPRAGLAHASEPCDRRQQVQGSESRDELRANLAYRSPVVLAEIRNRLVVGDKAAHKPHDLILRPASSSGSTEPG